MNSIKEKVVVITGASRGLGVALAHACAHEGAHCVLGGRNKEELEVVAQEIGGTAVVCDVTDEVQVKKLAQQTLEHFGRIDIWINNAGIWMPPTPIDEVDSQRMKNLFDVNVFGLIYGSKAAFEQMKKQGSGMIVNIISTSALEGRPLSSIYCATKFAVAGYTKSLTLAGAPHNILGIGIYPGGMKTHLFDEQAVPRPDWDDYMDPADVAKKIITHITQDTPDPEFIIRRPKQEGVGV